MRTALRRVFASSLVLAAVALAGCETAPKTETGKMNLHDDVVAALNKFKRTDPSLQAVLDKSAGYVVFPSIGKGGLIVGGAYGKGEVFQNGVSVGWADISQGSIGAQIGGQAFSEVIVFQTEEALARFMNNNFTFGADASAVALKSGAAATTEFKDGVAVFTMSDAGLMAGAVINGQKFEFVKR